MKAFFVLLVLAAAAMAEDVKEQQVKEVAEAKAEQAGDDKDLGSRFGGVIYAQPQAQPVYYWPYVAPSQLARSATNGAVVAYPYSPYYRYAYEYPYYNYNYYNYPYSAYYPYNPVVAAPANAPAPSVGSSPHGNY